MLTELVFVAVYSLVAVSIAAAGLYLDSRISPDSADAVAAFFWLLIGGTWFIGLPIWCVSNLLSWSVRRISEVRNAD